MGDLPLSCSCGWKVVPRLTSSCSYHDKKKVSRDLAKFELACHERIWGLVNHVNYSKEPHPNRKGPAQQRHPDMSGTVTVACYPLARSS